MKNLLFAVMGILMGAGMMYGASNFNLQKKAIVAPTEKPKPLLKYTIESLSKREYKSQIIIDGPVKTEKNYTVHNFHFDSDGKKVSGLLTMPIRNTSSPVIVQLRGYADLANYYPGYGTSHSAEKFAEAGFISIAPDFLGYGTSDMPARDVWEARLETYTTAANLIAAIKSLPMADANKIGLWGHSNGGQIALATLEILGKPIPTTLWAPQSLPFPYSIIYYLDENGESDRELRQSLAQFEADYDYKLFDVMGHLDKINAPIQLHQGTADEPIPIKFADKLATNLKAQMATSQVSYFVYPGADHNFLPIENWNKVVERDIQFFQKYFENTSPEPAEN